MSDISRLVASPYAPLVDGTGLSVTYAGKGGESIVADAHGQLYNLAVRGNLFHATTATAGTIVPVMATNLVSTFTLWNPAGSGKNAVLYKWGMAHTTTVTVVSDVSLYYQVGVGGATTAPTSLTALVSKNCLLGAGNPSLVTAYSAATLTGALGTSGVGNIAKGPTLNTFGAVTTTNPLVIEYRFEGGLILPPGTLVTTAGNAAQTAAMNQTYWWAEVPI